MATSGRALQHGDRLVPGVRREHLHPAPLEHAAQREDVAHVVVDDEHRLADQIFVGAVQALEHLLLVRRQVGDHAVQEQRRLVEQAFGRLDALDDDAARQRVELRVLVGRELPAGEHDDGHVARALSSSLIRSQHLEARHVGQPQVEHDAVAGLVVERGQRLRAGVGGDDVDVVVAEQLA